MGNGERPNIVGMTSDSGGETHEDSSSDSGSTTATSKTTAKKHKGVDKKVVGKAGGPGGSGSQKYGGGVPVQQKPKNQRPP